MVLEVGMLGVGVPELGMVELETVYCSLEDEPAQSVDWALLDSLVSVPVVDCTESVWDVVPKDPPETGVVIVSE